MARFEYSVKLPDGKIVTRKSDRTYTHAVCARGIRADVRKQRLTEQLTYNQQQLPEHEAVALGKAKGDAIFYTDRTEAQVRKMYAEFAEDNRQQIAHATAELAKPYDPLQAPLGVLGWTGTQALAEKRVNSEARYYAGVEVLAVTVREIKQRK